MTALEVQFGYIWITSQKVQSKYRFISCATGPFKQTKAPLEMADRLTQLQDAVNQVGLYKVSMFMFLG